MTGFDPIAISALNSAVTFLFDQAGKLMEERREARKKRGEKEDNTRNIHATKQTSKEEILSTQPKNVLLKDTPEEVKHCLDMIHKYRRNLRFIDDSIAHYGGFNLAPIYLRNELITYENEIKNWCQKLKTIVEEAYGHKVVIQGLD